VEAFGIKLQSFQGFYSQLTWDFAQRLLNDCFQRLLSTIALRSTILALCSSLNDFGAFNSFLTLSSSLVRDQIKLLVHLL